MAEFDGKKLKVLGVMTSGGDAPGMNAAIRSIVRFALAKGLRVKGIYQGYEGLVKGHIQEIKTQMVANILQRGGTILKTGRLPEFYQADIRQRAAAVLKDHQVDGLICIGGDGSLRGAHQLWKEHHIPVVGCPGTIDNDIYGTDLSIGFDSAVNTAMESIDKIRDTAASHDRLFIVEVMGRNSGFIATWTGLASGAEEIFFQQNPVTVDQAIEHIRRGMNRGKMSSILITAEGEKPGRAYDLAEAIRKKAGFEAKVCILGHTQRGGAPTAMDRVLGSRLGAFALENLLGGTCDVMVGLQGNQLMTTPHSEVANYKKQDNLSLVGLAQVLST